VAVSWPMHLSQNKSKSKKKRQKKRTPKLVTKNRVPSGVYTPPSKSWEEIMVMAQTGVLPEEQRSVVAKKATMIDALRVFEDNFNANLNKFNGNLGLLLGCETTIAGSLVIYGTGENGTNEFVPLLFSVRVVNAVQNLDDHAAYLKGDWYKPMQKEQKKEQKKEQRKANGH